MNINISKSPFVKVYKTKFNNFIKLFVNTLSAFLH